MSLFSWFTKKAPPTPATLSEELALCFRTHPETRWETEDGFVFKFIRLAQTKRSNDFLYVVYPPLLLEEVNYRAGANLEQVPEDQWRYGKFQRRFTLDWPEGVERDDDFVISIMVANALLFMEEARARQINLPQDQWKNMDQAIYSFAASCPPPPADLPSLLGKPRSGLGMYTAKNNTVLPA